MTLIDLVRRLTETIDDNPDIMNQELRILTLEGDILRIRDTDVLWDGTNGYMLECELDD